MGHSGGFWEQQDRNHRAKGRIWELRNRVMPIMRPGVSDLARRKRDAMWCFRPTMFAYHIPGASIRRRPAKFLRPDAASAGGFVQDHTVRSVIQCRVTRCVRTGFPTMTRWAAETEAPDVKSGSKERGPQAADVAIVGSRYYFTACLGRRFDFQ